MRKKTRPYTYRISSDEEWNAMYEGKMDNITGDAPQSLEFVCGILGEDDKYFDHQLLEKNFEFMHIAAHQHFAVAIGRRYGIVVAAIPHQ